MDAFVNVIRKDPKVRIKLNNTLDRYLKLPYNYQSKLGYDTLTRNVILKEVINKISTTITDSDIDLKLKFSRVKILEGKNSYK